jgi:S-DNA-T family DNA segregation ATPase FtsK/SpoIIIE
MTQAGWAILSGVFFYLAWRHRRALAPAWAALGLLLFGALGHVQWPHHWLIPLASGAIAVAVTALRLDRMEERVYVGVVGAVAVVWVTIDWLAGLGPALLVALGIAALLSAIPWWVHQLSRGDVEVVGGSRFPLEFDRRGRRFVRRWAEWRLQVASVAEIARARSDWPEAVRAAGLPGLLIEKPTVDRVGWTFLLRLRPGQTVEMVAKHVDQLASAISSDEKWVRRRGVQVLPHPEDVAHYCLLRVVFDDPLVATEWSGPATTEGDGQVASPEVRVRIGTFQDGRPVEIRITDQVHTLVAGTTGAGKGSLANTLVGELAPRRDVEIDGIDPARVELEPWGTVPEGVLRRFATRPRDMESLLQEELDEVQRRLDLLAARRRRDWSAELGPWRVLIVDELADLPRRAMGLLGDLAPKCRKTGVRLWLLTQRPLAETHGGNANIRAMCRRRICMQVAEDDADMCLGPGFSKAGWEPHKLMEPGSYLIYDPLARYITPMPARAPWVTDEAVEAARERYSILRPRPAAPPQAEAVDDLTDRPAVWLTATGVDGRLLPPSPGPVDDDPLTRLRRALAEAPLEGIRVENLALQLGMSGSWVYEQVRIMRNAGEVERPGRARYRLAQSPQLTVVHEAGHE